MTDSRTNGRRDVAEALGRLSRGGAPMMPLPFMDEREILGEMVLVPPRANLNKRQLRESELKTRAEIRQLLGADVHIRFRHVRSGESILVNAETKERQEISDRGDFTFASVDLPNGDIIIGAARCSPNDQWNRVYGRVKSLKRILATLKNGDDRWSLTLGKGCRPVTGWTIGAIQALRLKHENLDGWISDEDYLEASKNVGPFLQEGAALGPVPGEGDEVPAVAEPPSGPSSPPEPA